MACQKYYGKHKIVWSTVIRFIIILAAQRFVVKSQKVTQIWILVINVKKQKTNPYAFYTEAGQLRSTKIRS